MYEMGNFEEKGLKMGSDLLVSFLVVGKLALHYATLVRCKAFFSCASIICYSCSAQSKLSISS